MKKEVTSSEILKQEDDSLVKSVLYISPLSYFIFDKPANFVDKSMKRVAKYRIFVRQEDCPLTLNQPKSL